jgi:flagellar basal-body rod protein FlgF
MDRVLYTAMSSAKHIQARQAVISNNIANASTDGFKKDFLTLMETERRSNTRIHSEIKNTSTQINSGQLKTTGSNTDISIQNGWLAAIGKDGTEHYISSASTHINNDGMLVDGRDNLILNAGMDPIEIGAVKTYRIAADGVISAVPATGADTELVVIDTVGMFDIIGTLNKNESGFLVAEEAVASVEGKLIPGTVEGSNVVLAQEMLGMIENNRQYEFSVKLIEIAKGMHNSSTKILR